MKKIQDSSAFVFIGCVVVLALVSILGIWKIFDSSVIEKSAQTVALLAIVSVIMIVAGRAVDGRDQETVMSADPNLTPVINPKFTTIRHLTVVILILAVSLLALFGVLAIWEVLNGEVLHRALSSISVIVFSSFVIIVTCMEREQRKLMQNKISGWVWFFIILFSFSILRALLNL